MKGEYGIKPFEAISFDVWGTLLRSNQNYKNERNRLIAAFFGITEEDSSAVVKNADNKLDLLSEKTGRDFDFTDRIAHMANVLNRRFTPTALTELEGEITSLFLGNLPEPLEGDITLHTVAKLREIDKKICIVSNTGFINGQYMRLALTSLGLTEPVDVMLFSNEVGHAKPDQRIFKRLIAEAATKHLLHIGDNEITDYRGALNAGVQGRLLHYPTEEPYHIESLYDVIPQ